MTIWAYAHILLLPLFIYLSIFKSAVQFSHCVILPADLQVIKLHMRISHTVFNHLHEGLGWSRYGSSYGYALRNTLTGVSTEGSVNPTDEQDDQEPNRTVLRMDWVTNALLRIKQNRNELNRRNKPHRTRSPHGSKRRKGRGGGKDGIERLGIIPWLKRIGASGRERNWFSVPGDLGVRTCRVGEDGGLEKVRGATPPGGMEADGTCDKGTAVGVKLAVVRWFVRAIRAYVAVWRVATRWKFSRFFFES
jgi:hypothetical protein